MTICKKIIVIVLLLAGGFPAKAQRFTEKIWLKDSSYYEGYIIEQVPQQFFRMSRIKQQDTVYVPFTEIWKITRTFFTDSVKTKTPAVIPVSKRYHKAVFLELFGSAGLYSVNFDMRTERGRPDRWGVQAGIEMIGLKAKDSTTNTDVTLNILAFPMGVNYLVGKNKSFLELGTGVTYYFFWANGKSIPRHDYENYTLDVFDKTLHGVAGTFTIGYRHAPLLKGFMYRITLTGLLDNEGFSSTIGLAAGFKF